MSFASDEESRLWEEHKQRALRGGLTELEGPTPIPHPTTETHKCAMKAYGDTVRAQPVRTVLRKRRKPLKADLQVDYTSEDAVSFIMADWQRQSRGSVK